MASTQELVREVPLELANMASGRLLVADPTTNQLVIATIVHIESVSHGYRIYGRFRPSLNAPFGELMLRVRETFTQRDATCITMYSSNSGRPVMLKRT